MAHKHSACLHSSSTGSSAPSLACSVTEYLPLGCVIAGLCQRTACPQPGTGICVGLCGNRTGGKVLLLRVLRAGREGRARSVQLWLPGG